MAAPHYYLATSLPPLGGLGSRPPISLHRLAERLAGSTAAPLADAILLEEDLLQRDAFLAGEIADPAPAVLTAAQGRGRDPLPEPLRAESPADALTGPAIAPGPADDVWIVYWRYVAELAAERASAFLTAWIGAEVGLRNALVVARARSLGVEPPRHLVAPELGAPRPREDTVLAAWAASPNPLAGHQHLLRARWAWVNEHEPRYSFGDDELAAYAVRLVLLHRWSRAAHGDR